MDPTHKYENKGWTNKLPKKWMDILDEVEKSYPETIPVKKNKHMTKLGYTQIKIMTAENGYMAVDNEGKTFVFHDLDELHIWMKDKMAPTGEGATFINKL